MTTIIVTNNNERGNGSLREAIKKARSGDTIKFDTSLSERTIILDSQIEIKKSLLVDGSDAPGITVSGGERTNIFKFGLANESLTLRNLTLADSYSEVTAGSAIWAAENSTIELENTKFINNVSNGAALHALAGSIITAINSTFSNNDGAKLGDKPDSAGAIALLADGSLTIKNSVFTNNKGFGGGALHVTSSDLIVEDSIFTSNDSTAGADRNFMPVSGGGAIYSSAASVSNELKFNRGCLQETECKVFSVCNSRFENNRGAGEGGAIVAYGYNRDCIIIQNSEILNNEVIENKSGLAKGGGLWLMGYVEINNTTIANNKSADLGGGLYLWGEVPAKISNSSFFGNHALNGGAIYDGLYSSQLELDRTNFDSNSAVDRAGVFYLDNKPVSL